MTDGNSADLSDWTDSPSFEGEKATYRDLSRWIGRHTDATVYWNQTNAIGYDVFQTTSSEIPDLVTRGSDTIVYEVKNADGTTTEDAGSNHVNNGVIQLIDYWRDYVDRGVEYRVDGESIDVDAFVLATEMAPYGRLYTRGGNSDVLRTGSSEGRQTAVQYNKLPNNEFNSTERAIRLMWRFAEHQREDTDTGTGALLSTRLDEENPDAEHKPQSPIADYEPRILRKSSGQSWSSL
jgi:hypothetical protein